MVINIGLPVNIRIFKELNETYSEARNSSMTTFKIDVRNGVMVKTWAFVNERVFTSVWEPIKELYDGDR